MEFKQWADLATLKEDHFYKLQPNKPTVIFMDCQGVTGNHTQFNLYAKDPIYRVMADCAWRMAEQYNFDCVIYGAMDECSVVFNNTEQLYECFQMGDCGDYTLAMYIQRFLKYFWMTYPDIYVKNMILQYAQEEIERYIEYRQAICKYVASGWIAKEYLDKRLYKEIADSQESIESLLKSTGLYEKLVGNTNFYNGVLLRHPAKGVLDTISDAFCSGMLN